MAQPGILIENLTYAYPAGPTALAGIDLRIAAGESVALVGPNGAGKTSLFLCLAGVLPPQQGRITVAELDVAESAQRRQIPTKLGILFQSSEDQLFNATVFDDVAFGPLNLGFPGAEVQARVGASLRQVGLAGFEQRVPFHLSGGEKRRVALAGLLAMQPEILLLDEPSTHLDPRGRREMIKLINELGTTKLVAAHDLEFILQTCTRGIIMDGGRIIADGPVRRLFADRELMEAHGLEVPHSLTHPHTHFGV